MFQNHLLELLCLVSMEEPNQAFCLTCVLYEKCRLACMAGKHKADVLEMVKTALLWYSSYNELPDSQKGSTRA